MPYTPTTWTEGVTKLGPTNMNHLETGVSNVTTTADAAIAKPASPASNDGLVWNGSTWTNAKLVNANIDPAAAIVYSKLSLAGGIVNNDVANAAAIAISKIAVGGNVAQVVKGDGSVALSGTYRKTTAKAVNTTVSATDLLNGEITIAAGVMGSTGAIRLTVLGDWVQNSGGPAVGPRFQLVLGGTTLLDTGAAQSVATFATRMVFTAQATILNVGATNSQAATFRSTIGGNAGGMTAGITAFTTGEGVYACTTNGIGEAVGVNTAAVDTTLARALVLNVINGSASATYETKLLGALVEVI